MTTKIMTGVIEDIRSPEEKAQDFTHDEFLGMSAAHTWTEKPESSWKKYPIRDQNGSGMCGAFAGCKALGINNSLENNEFVNLNTAFVYNKRTNSGPGMWLQQLLDILCTYGAPKDDVLVSDKLTEIQANAMNSFTADQINEALKYRGKKYFTATPDMETFAQLIDLGITPILLIRCNLREWTSDPFFDPTVKVDVDYNIDHFIPGTEATLIAGEKRAVIEDSWGHQFGNNGIRRIKPDFFKNRVYAMGYVVDLKNEDIDKPLHDFTVEMGYGSTGSEVIALQKVLQYEKFLPTHTQAGLPLPLGNFLDMTARAIIDWQVSHGLMDFANEKNMHKVRFGAKSILTANNLYNK